MAARVPTALLVGVWLLAATSSVEAGSLRRSAVVLAVERVRPAVVNVATRQVVSSSRSRPGESDRSEGRAGGLAGLQSLGSAVIIDPEGYILTNEHVVLRSTDLKVILADQRIFDAEVIGSDSDSDLALLKVRSGERLPAAALSDVSELYIGETAVAIGNPFGLRHSVTMGVVSAVGRTFRVGKRTYSDFIQTDAAIDRGYSGGPLLNIDGDIIGITTAIYSEGRGIGFAIPADRARRFVADILRYGRVNPIWIGVETSELPSGQAQDHKLAGEDGLVVTRVHPGTPAAEAGIEPGDVLLSLSGKSIETVADLDTYTSHHSAGDVIKLKILHRGSRRTVLLHTLEAGSPRVERLIEALTGLTLAERDGAGLEVASVVPDSRAAEHGLEPGDVIFELNGTRLVSLDAWRNAFFQALGSRSVLLLVKRDEAAEYLSFKIH